MLVQETGHTVLNRCAHMQATFIRWMTSPSTRVTALLKSTFAMPAVTAAFNDFQPDWVMHLAAESHVDRSIDGPGAFIQTNVIGTFNMLQAARAHYEGLEETTRIISASCTSPLMKSTARSEQKGSSRKPRHTIRTPLTRPVRHPRITWHAHGPTHTDCPSWSPIAPTTTVPISSRRN